MRGRREDTSIAMVHGRAGPILSATEGTEHEQRRNMRGWNTFSYPIDR